MKQLFNEEELRVIFAAGNGTGDESDKDPNVLDVPHISVELRDE